LHLLLIVDDRPIEGDPFNEALLPQLGLVSLYRPFKAPIAGHLTTREQKVIERLLFPILRPLRVSAFSYRATRLPLILES